MKSEVVYGPDGTATGVRHAWTFDDMFSTFATQGLDSKEKGKFTREELAPLAEVNVTSLKEFDFFTDATPNGKKADLNEPVDYYLEFTDGLLTLHFTCRSRRRRRRRASTSKCSIRPISSTSRFAEKEPVRAGRRAGAASSRSLRPGEGGAQAKPQGQPGEAFFNNLGPASNYGAQFANKISVKCP